MKKIILVLVILLTTLLLVIVYCGTGMKFQPPPLDQVQANTNLSPPSIEDVPSEPGAPWPSMRHDSKNTGNGNILCNYMQGDEPWFVPTGKGIFSTPIVDSKGIIYVGSANHYFYALYPDGTVKWKVKTGEMIDSAGTISELDESLGTTRVIFPSGDGHLYCLRSDNGEEIWSVQVHDSETTASYIDWWEGNVVFGPDGNLYAGNTNWFYYCINPTNENISDEERILWKYHTGDNAWSASAFDDKGNIYWGSLDMHVHAVNPLGENIWKKMTFGFISSSASIGTDGTIYITSFDRHIYALDQETGADQWKVPTGDHIYGSAAQGFINGETAALYFGSADGKFYKVNTDGEVEWTYDTGDVIRSSAAIGQSPDGNNNIIYFGCGNGKIYALNDDGTRRWSYDTTPDDPILKDRNDVNASIALGTSGLYTASESGHVLYVPYDYCLHNEDERCSTDPGEEFADNISDLLYVTSGGSTLTEDPDSINPATIITNRLIVRENGQSKEAYAWIKSIRAQSKEESINISPEPAFDFYTRTSADGRFIYLIPESILDYGEYSITYDVDYFSGGMYAANLLLGGEKAGNITDTFAFSIPESSTALPLSVDKDETSALQWARLSVPLPAIMASVNQIGFDTWNWILGTIIPPDPNYRDGQFLMWAIGGRFDEDGVLVADALNEDNLMRAALNGQYKDNHFILKTDNYSMSVLNFTVPFSTFQLRGQLLEDGTLAPGAVMYAEAPVSTIDPQYQMKVVAGGIASATSMFDTSGTITAAGTCITNAYSNNGPANKRPQGIRVEEDNFEYTPSTGDNEGWITVNFSYEDGATYSLENHIPAIVLVDMNTLTAININYLTKTFIYDDNGGVSRWTAEGYDFGATGNLKSMKLIIPSDVELGENTKAYVILDVFPLASIDID